LPLDSKRLADALFAMSCRAGQDLREHGLGNVGASILPLAVQEIIASKIDDLKVPVGVRRVHRAPQRFDPMQRATKQRRSAARVSLQQTGYRGS